MLVAGVQEQVGLRRLLDEGDGLVAEFAQLPREGNTVHGLVIGLYPTDYPTLPEPNKAPT